MEKNKAIGVIPAKAGIQNRRKYSKTKPNFVIPAQAGIDIIK
jgi:hypothetical protein